MKFVLPLALALMLNVSPVAADSLVDDYELIEAESGISEFTADLAGLFNAISTRVFLVKVELELLGKLEHQPKSAWMRTYIRLSRSYVWLSKFADRKELENFAKGYAMRAEIFDQAVFGHLDRANALREEVDAVFDAQPELNDGPSKATRQERDGFVDQYAAGL